MTRSISLRKSAVLLALVALPACSNMTVRGSQAERPAVAAQPPVSSDLVRQVQSKLQDTGYYKQGAVDGVWGAGTETAVANFQRDHSLTSSGKLDVPTLQALNLTGSRDQAGMPLATTPGATVPTTNRPVVTAPVVNPPLANGSVATQPMGSNMPNAANTDPIVNNPVVGAPAR